jgi:hypothetical protein
MNQKSGSTRAKAHPKRKKGYYAARFHSSELEDLQADSPAGLLDEIELMRVIIRRLFEITSDEAASLDDWSKAVSTLGSAASRLSRLLLANRQLVSSSEVDNEVKRALENWLRDVMPPGPEQRN